MRVRCPKLNAVAGNRDQRFPLGEIEARILLPVLGDVVAPKFEGFAFAVKMDQHVASVAHDMIMALPGQFRDFLPCCIDALLTSANTSPRRTPRGLQEPVNVN